MQAFRDEARGWLDTHVGPYRVDVNRDSPSLVFADVTDTEHVVRGRAWQRVLHDGGWAGLGWPLDHGGRGLPIWKRMVWAQEAAAAGAPPAINLIGESIVGPTLMAYGTQAQRERYLPRILTGEEIWCQLFSEPDAGSDIAAVRTSAEPDPSGREWRIDGHKIWTSAAHYSQFGLLLARSNWRVPKHEGCSAFIVDMGAPGVRTRPLRQMTGGAAFNEVFLDGVAVADSQRLGRQGQGWEVARTTLDNERLNLGLGLARVAGGVDRMLADYALRAEAADPVVRQLAAQLYVESRCVAHLGERAVARLAEGEAPGAEGTLAKLASARVSRRCDEFLDAMRGSLAMTWDDYSLVQLWIPATSIAGGTDEILRTVVAERVLGLPRPRRADRDVPFGDLVPTRDQSSKRRPQ